MQRIIGTEDFSTWARCRSPLWNSDNQYNMVLSATYPYWAYYGHNTEYNGGRYCITWTDPPPGGTFCYPEAFFITEHGTMLRAAAYPQSGAATPGISYDVNPYANDQYNYTGRMWVSMHDQEFEEMVGAQLTGDLGSTTIDQSAKDFPGQDIWSNQQQYGSGWIAIEKLTPIPT